MVRSIGAVVVPLLMVVIMVAPTVLGASCSAWPSGTVSLPTGTPGPPPFNWPTVANGIQSYYVDILQSHHGEGFELRALTGTAQVGNCAVDPEVCITLPDFNVCWYNQSDSRIACDIDYGDQVGEVPQGTSYALVYMRYGPGTEQDFLGASFELALGCR